MEQVLREPVRLTRIRRELAFLDGLVAQGHPDVRGIRAAQEDWILDECFMMMEEKMRTMEEINDEVRKAGPGGMVPVTDEELKMLAIHPVALKNTYKFEKYFAPFTEQVHARMTKGAEEYGDGSFDRPLLNQIEEIQEELADVAGWSLVKWGSLEELKKKVIVLEGRVAEVEVK